MSQLPPVQFQKSPGGRVQGWLRNERREKSGKLGRVGSQSGEANRFTRKDEIKSPYEIHPLSHLFKPAEFRGSKEILSQDWLCEISLGSGKMSVSTKQFPVAVPCVSVSPRVSTDGIHLGIADSFHYRL